MWLAMGIAEKELKVDEGAGRRWWMGVGLVVALFIALTRDLWTYTGVARGDVLNFFLPYYMLLADFVRHGQLMIWDPWSSGGLPIFADAQTGALSPLTNLFALLTGPSTGGYLLYSLAMWLLGPLGIMVLGRNLRAPVWGCIMAAVGYMTCGVYLGQPHHLSHQVSFSFIPWIIWRLDVALTQKRIWPAIESAALLGLSGLGGYPGLTFLTGLYAAIWAIGRLLCGWRQYAGRDVARLALAGAAAAVVLAIVLAPPYLGILYEGRGYTSRSEPLGRDVAINVQPTAVEALPTMGSTAAQLAVNEYLQTLSPDERVLPMRVSIGCGLVTLALALCAMIWGWREPFRWVVLVLGVLLLELATGREMPLRQWLYDLVPPVRMFRHASLFRDYWLVSAACLALWASADLAKMNWRNLRPLAVVACVIGVVSAITYILMTRHVGVVGGWMASAQLALAAVLAAVCLWPGGMARFGGYALATIAILDASLAVSLCSNLTFAFRDDNARDYWRKFDQQWKSDLTVSVDRQAVISGWNEHLVTKTPVLASYTPLRNDMLPRANDEQDQKREALQRLAFATGTNRFWWSDKPVLVSPGRVGEELLRSDGVGTDALRVHMRDDLVDSHDAAAVASAVVVRPAGEQPPPMRPIDVHVLRYTPTTLAFAATSPGKGYLLVTDRWSRSWRATVNGKPTEVRGGNHLYRAIEVPAGKVQVRFTFASTWVYALTMASWLTLLAVAVLSVKLRLVRPPEVDLATGQR